MAMWYCFEKERDELEMGKDLRWKAHQTQDKHSQTVNRPGQYMISKELSDELNKKCD